MLSGCHGLMASCKHKPEQALGAPGLSTHGGLRRNAPYLAREIVHVHGGAVHVSRHENESGEIVYEYVNENDCVITQAKPQAQ